MNEFYRSQTCLIPTMVLAVLGAAGSAKTPSKDKAERGATNYCELSYYESAQGFDSELLIESLEENDSASLTPEIESGWNLLASVLLKDSRSMDSIEREALEECFWAV